MVKVFGCRPAAIERLGESRRSKAAHARTRGSTRRSYGDLGDLTCLRRVPVADRVPPSSGDEDNLEREDGLMQAVDAWLGVARPC